MGWIALSIYLNIGVIYALARSKWWEDLSPFAISLVVVLWPAWLSFEIYLDYLFKKWLRKKGKKDAENKPE